jgi:hypothetical protein
VPAPIHKSADATNKNVPEEFEERSLGFPSNPAVKGVHPWRRRKIFDLKRHGIKAAKYSRIAT